MKAPSRRSASVKTPAKTRRKASSKVPRTATSKVPRNAPPASSVLSGATGLKTSSQPPIPLGQVLTLADPVTYLEPLAQWPLPLNQPFMGSRELDLLSADLKRYVQGRVRGRSYLIAGHRGAGKTALVTRAVEQLVTDILKQSVLDNPVDLPDGPLERPLLVKLHGPTMLQEPATTAESGKPASKPASDSAAAKGEEPANPPQPTGVPGADPAAGVHTALVQINMPASIPSTDVAAGVHAALVQITLGLYRALAAEAATGFRAHALNRSPKPRDDETERAAQLALELDGGARPALLRSYWAALGRLQRGVFWPATADPTCDRHQMADQGLREIAALATAAQAFQVCTGRISYETKSSESAARKLTSEFKGATDLKNALSRLGTLGIGAVTGVSLVSLHQGPVAAAIAGLGVWLLGSASLSWSRSSARDDNRSIDYSFIRDFTLATLERDLPVVINRVREAGLVPVFVIDELDKLCHARRSLSDLIGRLKHLIADHGFFCFLVNRDCFEEVEARIRSRAYPAEHTLFSERLLLRPDPGYALTYVMGLVGGDPADPQFGLAKVTFALVVMFQAQLNLTDMMRALARSAKGEARSIGTAAELTEPRLLVLATVQLAINATLKSPSLAARMSADAAFAQLALDTLYGPARSWSQAVMEVDPSLDALRQRLEERMRSDRPEGGECKDHPEEPKPTIEEADLELLQEHLDIFLQYLCDLNSLRLALGDSTVRIEESVPPVRLADVPPQDIPRICETLARNRGYRFLFDRDGEPVTQNRGRLNAEERKRAKELIAYVDALELLLANMELSFDDLARTPLLRSFSGPVVARAKAGLSDAVNGAYDLNVGQHLSTLERLNSEIQVEREKLGELLILIQSMKRDMSGDQSLIVPAILRLIPFQLPPSRWLSGRPAAPPHAIPAESKGLAQWSVDYQKWLLPAPGEIEPASVKDYEPLASRLLQHFAKPRSVQPLQFDYRFLVRAARDELPAAALHSNLSNVTVGDWSRLAWAAAAPVGGLAQAPFWMFPAALRGLGFGKSALMEFASVEFVEDVRSRGWKIETEEMTAIQGLELVRRIADTAGDRPGGLLFVETEEQRFGSDKPVERRPTLVIDRERFDDYLPVLQWLKALGILTGQLGSPDAIDR